METVWFGAHLRRVPDEKGFMIGSVAKLRESSVRSERKPNRTRYSINQRWCRIRQLRWTVQIRKPRSEKIHSEGSDIERREIWIWGYDGLVFLPLNNDECSFLVFVKWRKTFLALQFHASVDCVTRYLELIRSPLVPIALNGLQSVRGRLSVYGCLVVMDQDLILFVRREIYLTRGKLSYFPFNKSIRYRHLFQFSHGKKKKK